MDEEKPISLEKYIEELEYFYKIYSLGDTNGDMAEELMIYECLISWLKELQKYRSKNVRADFNTCKQQKFLGRYGKSYL